MFRPCVPANPQQQIINQQRDTEIIRLHEEGWKQAAIAAQVGITVQRVWQIVKAAKEANDEGGAGSLDRRAACDG